MTLKRLKSGAGMREVFGKINILALVITAAAVFQIIFLFHFQMSFISINGDQLLENVDLENSVLIVYPKEFVNVKLKEKKISLITISESDSYINIKQLNKYSKIYFLTLKDYDREITLHNFRKKEILNLSHTVLYRLLYPAKEMIDSVKDIKVAKIYNDRVENGKLDGNSIRYGKNDWDYLGPKKVEVSGIPFECMWLHPEVDFGLKVDWPVKSGRELSIMLVANDTADIKISYRIEFSLKDAAGRTAFTSASDIKGEDLEYPVFFNFDANGISEFSFNIKADAGSKNRLCLMGNLFNER